MVRDLGSRQESGKKGRQDGVQARSWICRGGVIMARMTKAQKKRMLMSIQSKASKLFTASPFPSLSMKDYDAIIKITDRQLNKLK